MMPKANNLLILGAAYGAGHMQAASALQNALLHRKPEWNVELYNFVHEVNPFFDAFSRWFYLSLVRYSPFAYQCFYYLTDSLGAKKDFILDRFGVATLLDMIGDLEPKAIIATFPTPGRVAASLKLKKKVRVAVIMVITDHTVHSEWIHPGVDLYLVPNEEVKERMVNRGVNGNIIEVTGIPIHPKFCHLPPRNAAKKNLGLDAMKPVVLLVGGGNGRVAAMEEMCQVFHRFPHELQVLVVTGEDERYLKKLKRTFAKDPRFHFFGFVDGLAEFMAASDLLVGKAGALTLAEAAAARLPIIIYKCLPAQEKANAQYYTRYQAAWQTDNPRELYSLAERILAADEKTAKKLEASLSRLARPEAAFNCADSIIKFLEENEDS